MRNAAVLILCAALSSLAANAYADDAPLATAVPDQSAVSTPAATTSASTTLSSDERAQLVALDTQSAGLELQSAGRACTYNGDTDCTRTTDCTSQVLTFGIVGVLVGSFGGAAGAVGGGAIGAGVGYGICASAN